MDDSEPTFNVDRVRMIKLDTVPALMAQGIKVSRDTQTALFKVDTPNILKFDFVDFNSRKLVDPTLDTALEILPPYMKQMLSDRITKMIDPKEGTDNQRDMLELFLDSVFDDRVVSDQHLKGQFLATIGEHTDKPFLIIAGHGEAFWDPQSNKVVWEIGNRVGSETTDLLNFLRSEDVDLGKYSAVLIASCNTDKLKLEEKFNAPVFYKVGGVAGESDEPLGVASVID